MPKLTVFKTIAFTFRFHKNFDLTLAIYQFMCSLGIEPITFVLLASAWLYSFSFMKTNPGYSRPSNKLPTMLKIPQINIPEGQWFYLSSGAWTNLTDLLLFVTTHPVNPNVSLLTLFPWM